MKKKFIGILDLNCNNIQSINESCKKIGYKTFVIKKNKDFKKNFSILVMPGVGSFLHAMKYIRKNKIDIEIKKFIENKKNKIIGICLGMQLLFEESSEFGETKGIGLIKGNVKKLPTNKVPVIGWNKIKFKKNKYDLKKFEQQFFYFVHSYYCKSNEIFDFEGKSQSENFEYLGCFKKENIFGLQFHPEKSHLPGLKLLNKVLKI